MRTSISTVVLTLLTLLIGCDGEIPRAPIATDYGSCDIAFDMQCFEGGHCEESEETLVCAVTCADDSQCPPVAFASWEEVRCDLPLGRCHIACIDGSCPTNMICTSDDTCAWRRESID